MAKHEDEIRTLAKSPLGGQRFEQFIAWWQWEMLQQNKEPMPEDSKSAKYGLASHLLKYQLTILSLGLPMLADGPKVGPQMQKRRTISMRTMTTTRISFPLLVSRGDGLARLLGRRTLHQTTFSSARGEWQWEAVQKATDHRYGRRCLGRWWIMGKKMRTTTTGLSLR